MSTLVCCSVGCKVYNDVMDRGITTLVCCSVGCKVCNTVMEVSHIFGLLQCWVQNVQYRYGGIIAFVCCSVGCSMYSNMMQASHSLSAVVLHAACVVT